MVNIDTVYQRVLAFANKEQRGYITPQEFNLFANQAQLEIFEQYFYDLNQFARVPGNEYVYADVDDILEEKIQIFESEDLIGDINGYVSTAGGIPILPSYIYRVERVEWNGSSCEILKTKDFRDTIAAGRLVAPSVLRPTVNVRDNLIRVSLGTATFVRPTAIYYLRKPIKVQWGFVVLNERALYDPSSQKTTNFELHASEESELVYKILKFAGLAMKRDDIARGGQGLEQLQTKQEKQ
tara:strand:+ start:103 stop:819 length:717 start_codon:yes stop_codon:yes gene_type:complete